MDSHLRVVGISLNEVASVTRPRRLACSMSGLWMDVPQRSCLGNKTEAVIFWKRLQMTSAPQRSCLGNKTEACSLSRSSNLGFWPQRSCLGNKTEAAGRIKGPSQGMILTRHETLSAAGRTFCLLNQGFYHQTLVTSRDSLARDQPVSKVLRPLASHDDGGIILNHPTLADPRHWKARGALVAKCGHED